jgi:hypothetical protein
MDINLIDTYKVKISPDLIFVGKFISEMFLRMELPQFVGALNQDIEDIEQYIFFLNPLNFQEVRPSKTWNTVDQWFST